MRIVRCPRVGTLVVSLATVATVGLNASTSSAADGVCELDGHLEPEITNAWDCGQLGGWLRQDPPLTSPKLVCPPSSPASDIQTGPEDSLHLGACVSTANPPPPATWPEPIPATPCQACWISFGKNFRSCLRAPDVRIKGICIAASYGIYEGCKVVRCPPIVRPR
jgi:hypothetical protein